MVQIEIKKLEKAIDGHFTILKDYMRLAFLCDNDCKIYYTSYQDIADKLNNSYAHVLNVLKKMRRLGLLKDVNREYIQLLYIKKE